MGSSHPDDVGQPLVPGDPGSPDGTAGLPDEPADWDDAWLPEWLDGETDRTPPVEHAASGPEPDVALAPEPDAEPGGAGEPQPDAEPRPDLEPEPEDEPDVEAGPDAEPESGA